jgi:hypothetical protein
VKRILKYLDARFDGNVRVIDLARQVKSLRVNLSEASLARAFKAEGAFAEYLTYEDRNGAKTPVLYLNWKAVASPSTTRQW